jgi:hypothetical protein
MKKTTPTGKADLHLPLDASGRLVLPPEIEAMASRIRETWELSPAVDSLLRTACEQLAIAQACDAVVSQEGLSLVDRSGGRKSHPCATLAATCRTSASGALNRIHQSLS